jgi:ankyrin repeat protein
MDIRKARKKIRDGKLPVHIYFEGCQNDESVETLERLISLNPKGITEKDDFGNFPVYYAIRNCVSASNLIVLLGAASDVLCEQGSDGFNALQWALMSGMPPSALRILLNNRPELIVEGIFAKNSALASATKFHATNDVLKVLLSAYPNACSSADGDGNLPVHIGCKHRIGLAECLLLLQAYAQGATARTSAGKTALHLAVEFTCNPEVIDLLLENNAEGSAAKDSSGKLPIHCCFGSPSAISELRRWAKFTGPPGAQLTSSGSDVLGFSSAEDTATCLLTAYVPITEPSFSICFRVDSCEPLSIQSLGICAGQWRNSVGCVVRGGTDASCAHLFYCGRRMGTDIIPGSDGRCGPSSGPQCPDCRGLTTSNPPFSPPSNVEEDPSASGSPSVLFGATRDSWGLVNNLSQSQSGAFFYSGRKVLNNVPRKLQV